MQGQKDESLNLGYVIDNSLQQLAKLGFLACIIAWCFTCDPLLLEVHALDLLRACLSTLFQHWYPTPVTPKSACRLHIQAIATTA